MGFTHDDYRVALICALPLEMAAVKTMLDEVHPPLPQAKSDQNTYTLGSISSHKVVVACLPSGVYGVTSAATVLVDMRRTFLSLKFGLMVGIGGGVPSKTADIRLGDVVVSMPTGTSGGVIQYDSGKTVPGGFRHTGSLNKPPQLLLTALSQMRSDHVIGERPMTAVIADTLQKHQQHFSRPDNDWLFDTGYEHQGDDQGPQDNCLTCDQTQLVIRKPRPTNEPHIHYGLIASGNQVMKDAKKRDAIAQEMGVLCFEMEAAGLMDQLPCLVIRGICDYCDSHKHKQWQGFAALVAASYAKALLTVVPMHDGGATPKKEKENRRMIPFPRNSAFVGREDEIARIQQLITKPNGPTKIAIYGLGGVGKTQIALEIAYRMQEKDPSCPIFWIPCTSYESVEQTYMSIAQKVGKQNVNLKPADAKELVRAHFNQESAGKWILIFDNADDMDMWINDSQTAPALKKSLPQSQHGRIIFTTRNRLLAVKMAGSQVVPVSKLDPQTALKMLGELLIDNEAVKEQSAIDLLEKLTYLPLAITQAAAYINENDISILTYLGLLDKQESDVIELLTEDFEDDGRYDDIQNPIATTWWISFQQIQQLNPLAADYLSFMACINPRDIPQSLLPPASENKGIKALSLLKNYSFITKQGDSNFWSLHRLVHLATRSWLRKQQQFSSQILKAADHFSEIFPDDEHDNRQLWRQYLPHSLALLGDDYFQEKKDKYNILFWKIAQCLHEDGRYNEAELLYKQAIEIEKQVLGPEHPSTLTSMHNLASTYWNQGRLKEAEELQVQVMETQKQVLGPEHPSTLTSMNNLALTYQNQGQWKEAEELQVQVMETRKQVLGPEHPSTLTSMGNLASTYWNQGRWNKAEELEVQVMETWKQVLGPEHPSTLTSMNNLASTYRNQGQWKEAEELQVQVMETRKQVLGPEHPDTLTSMGNLASTYWNQGRWNKAEELGVQVMETWKQVLGPEHPSTLTSMNNLASTYRNQGQWKEAEELLIQVIETRKQVLGPEHPDTLTSMNNLALTYQNQGRWKEAEILQAEELKLCSQVLGPEHPDTLTSMNNLAFTRRAQGRDQDALDLMEECVELHNRILGPDHPDTKSSSRSLRKWKKTMDNEQHQDPQAPRENAVESPPVVVISKADDEERITRHQRLKRLTTPIKRFIKRHPF